MPKGTHRLAVASLAILTAAVLAACSGGTDTAAPPPGPAQPASPGQSTPAAPASRPATALPASQSAGQPARGTDFGYLRGWYAKTGTIYLRFDRAILLTGDAADKASAAHGGESPVANDMYIQNDNPRLRDLAVIDQAKVVGSQQLTGNPGPNPSSLKALLTFLANGGPQASATPFHLRYDDNGLIIRIQEQYVP